MRSDATCHTVAMIPARRDSTVTHSGSILNQAKIIIYSQAHLRLRPAVNLRTRTSGAPEWQSSAWNGKAVTLLWPIRFHGLTTSPNDLHCACNQCTHANLARGQAATTLYRLRRIEQIEYANVRR